MEERAELAALELSAKEKGFIKRSEMCKTAVWKDMEAMQEALYRLVSVTPRPERNKTALSGWIMECKGRA